MFGVPKPKDFNDGLRQLFSFAMMAAGLVCGAIGVGLIGLLLWGPWSLGSETIRLYIYAGVFAAFLTGMLIVIVSMAVGGPVGRFKVNAGREGVGIEAAGDGEPIITTQTTTTVTAPPIAEGEPPSA